MFRGITERKKMILAFCARMARSQIGRVAP